MELELRYAPAGRETTILIDGMMTDPKDIYGFLYPVRHMLLQCWLEPSGSWPGLARQLEELRRGDALTLTFRGREADWEDLSRALAGMEDLELRFECVDRCRRVQERLERFRSSLYDILTEEVTVAYERESAVTRTGANLFPEIMEKIQALWSREDDWLTVIDNQADYRAAMKQDGCCLVREGYLSSFGRLASLTSLTRSMRRAGDMIICEFRNEETYYEYSAYGREIPGLDAHFALEGQDDWRGELLGKYGIPWLAGREAGKPGTALECFEKLMEMKPKVDREVRERRRNGEESEALTLLEYRQTWLRYLGHQLPRLRKEASDVTES